MGRQISHTDYLYDGHYNGTVAFQKLTTYNAKSQAIADTTTQRQGNDTIGTYTNTDHGYGSGYALGAAVSISTSTYKNGSYQYHSTTTNAYAWYAGAVVSTTTYAQTGQATYTSYHYYGGSGQLNSVYVADGRARSITYTNDMTGQVIRRAELTIANIAVLQALHP